MAARTLRLNWCATCGGGRNFGDQLGPLLLRHYGFDVTWAKPADAELVTVGSILSKVPPGWRGTVLGTGFIRAGMHKDLSRARVLAVRGVATREACGLPPGTPLGDMGLLVGDLPRATVAHAGPLVVPHTVDHAIAARHPGVPVLSVKSDPAVVIGTIAAASVVYTSTLHGLITADVLGVPHVLEPHIDVHGGLFKYRDYASAFGERMRPGVERLTDRDAMAARVAALRALVELLR